MIDMWTYLYTIHNLMTLIDEFPTFSFLINLFLQLMKDLLTNSDDPHDIYEQQKNLKGTILFN